MTNLSSKSHANDTLPDYHSIINRSRTRENAMKTSAQSNSIFKPLTHNRSLHCLLLVLTLTGLQPAFAAEDAVKIPPPALDQTVQANTALDSVVLAGGCFWGVQAVFQHTL